MNVSVNRRVERVVSTKAPSPGFAGPGHLAVEVVTPTALTASDPFVLLMDDRLDFADGQRVGGEHPHAGLETVTLVLEGSIRDRDEGTLSAGDALWMTAGRGIIHNESVEATGPSRVLQLWITLPEHERSTAPSFEIIPKRTLPVRREPGVELRLYSGTSGSLHSPTKNHVPMTLADIALAPGASVEQDLPASYNGFLYVIDGTLEVGDDQVPLQAGQVGWLDRPTRLARSTLRLEAGAQGARVVLYAGEPQHAAIVQHGPFVAESEAAIVRLFHEYRAGRFQRMSELARIAHAG